MQLACITRRMKEKEREGAKKKRNNKSELISFIYNERMH